jgi:hypothetical protein
MALFSRRFWKSVVDLDRRVANAAAQYDSAAKRFRTSRTTVSTAARAEFHLELCEAVAELRVALRDLRAFQDRNPITDERN